MAKRHHQKIGADSGGAGRSGSLSIWVLVGSGETSRKRRGKKPRDVKRSGLTQNSGRKREPNVLDKTGRRRWQLSLRDRRS